MYLLMYKIYFKMETKELSTYTLAINDDFEEKKEKQT